MRTALTGLFKTWGKDGKLKQNINFILNYSFRFISCYILWNIEISYNKQNIVGLFYCIAQLACYIRIKMFLSF